ncbi:MAG: hypothetical protein ACR2H4_12310 [Pyrinomonadaceae bacterium]
MRATAVAITLGLVLVLVTPTLFGLVPGPYSRLYMPLMIGTYGISGIALGFVWPERGWRLGLWLGLFWVVLLLIALPFSDPVPWNLRLVIKDLIDYSLIVIAGPLGGAVGAIISRRRMVDASRRS